ncbi:BCCT family transporter [Rothia halotolerans]|uniref:BCCT family transporter n=1 Tax=Rothia halotolerans TaxID=405770 RepID=UPI00101CA3AC|nr:BCCT family transporter [Rothia halotolerans]
MSVQTTSKPDLENGDDAVPAPPRTDRWVTGISAGALGAFVLGAIIFPETVSSWVDAGLSASARWFGPYWQVLLLVTFLVAIVLAFTPWARARLGGTSTPEFGRFKWVAMVMSTLLAGGGVFWAAAEPVNHLVTTPPHFEGEVSDPVQAGYTALAQSFVHWGFLAWAIIGSLGTIVMMYGVQKGMPLRPRTLLYPIMGAKVARHWIGAAADIVSIIAMVAGTVGPIGFLGLQVSYGLSAFFGVPDVYLTQLLVIAVLVAVACASVISGLGRGIQILSRANIWLAVALMALILVLGSAWYIVRSFVGGLGVYAQNFLGTTLYQGDAAWLSQWTLFFFGWFLGYAPLMAIFIARISRGRTVRDLIVSTTVLPPLVSCLWFTVLGGTGIMFEQRSPGSISGPLEESGLPAAVMAISSQLPLTLLVGGAFLLLTIVFVATTADSMSYSIAQACSPVDEPSTSQRVLWAVIMGLAAAVLISIGDGGINALQSFIVVTAVPAGFLMLPAVWAAPMYVRRLAKEQGIGGTR